MEGIQKMKTYPNSQIRKKLKAKVRRLYTEKFGKSCSPATSISSYLKDELNQAGIPKEDHLIFALNSLNTPRMPPVRIKERKSQRSPFSRPVESENAQKRRHAGYDRMSPRDRWAYDKRHGMLDD